MATCVAFFELLSILTHTCLHTLITSVAAMSAVVFAGNKTNID